MTVEKRLLRFVEREPGNIVLRTNVAPFGCASQVTVALRSLLAKGVLVRIGLGVYAKTRVSTVTGAVVPAGSLETLAVEALGKLGVSFQAGQAAAAYNSGAVTQLPGSFVVNTGARRIQRQLTVGGRTIVYEHD